ncbi:6-bladed beta-propeller [Flavivirga spongiicola]|uniref:6-bladed beta-propeller n=1 Tax=Flavivirga spongiicola TaxID=421621 RepID=A0ABU7XME4_9FLAO|nr:6-bladed beta-propeller [Flavivirga sp. MEBiC05379]MDO5981581.1 6-bladed beta-propeller [Flavivirga sp. MEBiC05379]
MRKIGWFLFIGILFLACEKSEQQQGVIHIDISPNSFKEPIQLNLSSIATKIEYIPLETNNNVLLGAIYNSDVTFFEKTILLKDKGELLVFDSKGKFLNTIGDIGNGPGEHSKNFQFKILPKKKLIAIYDQSKNKVFFHEFDGQFISEIAIDFNPSSFIVFNDHLIFFNAQYRRKDSDYNIISIVTKEGDVKKRLLSRSDEKALEKKINIFLRFDIESQNRLNNKFYFLEDAVGESEKTIWELSDDFHISPKYNISVGNNIRPIKDYASINNTFFKYNDIHGYIETPKYIFFKMIWGGKNPPHSYMIYDKEKNNTLWVQNSMEKRWIHSFVNDIDGGIPFWPFWKVSHNKVASPVMVSQLKKYLEEHKINKDQVLSPNDRMRLEKIVANTKETDNPILMVVTLKTD